MTLAPLQRVSTAASACADALWGVVLRGEVAPGERLTPERELAAQLGVDRGTLRGGLARLLAAGVIAARQGAGTVVRDWRATGGLDLLAPLFDHATATERARHTDDLLLLRRHLAGAVLAALVERPPGPAAIAAVAARVDAFTQLVALRQGGDPAATDAALLAAGLDVLFAVVDATERPVLRLALNPVVTALSTLPALQQALVADAAHSVPAYAALLGFLEAPGPGGLALLVDLLAARDAQTTARLRQAARAEGAAP